MTWIKNSILGSLNTLLLDNLRDVHLQSTFLSVNGKQKFLIKIIVLTNRWDQILLHSFITDMIHGTVVMRLGIYEKVNETALNYFISAVWQHGYCFWLIFAMPIVRSNYTYERRFFSGLLSIIWFDYINHFYFQLAFTTQ